MTNKSLYTNQFGFCKNNSTLHALLNIYVAKLQISLTKETNAMGVFIDLQKAFDTVYHDIPLYDLI